METKLTIGRFDFIIHKPNLKIMDNQTGICIMILELCEAWDLRSWMNENLPEEY